MWGAMSPEARNACILVAAVDAVRLAGAAPLGLGDAEALYATYARHLQGGYLDHPPLIGWIDHLVLSLWSSAFALRSAAVLLFTLSAYLLFRLARALFDDRAAWWAVVLLCTLPVFHLGGLAAAPDAPLAPLWLAWLLVGWRAFEHAAGASGGRCAGWPFVRAGALGLLLGAAFLAKYSALALVPAGVVFAWPLGGRLRWAALGIAASAAFAAALPVLLWNAEHGFASAAHRLVWSQPDPGPSLRNLGALIGGQLLYVSPVAAAGFVWAVVGGWRRRDERPVRFCLIATLVPFAVLAAVSLCSRVAEPHWPVPAYYALLPLAGHFAARGGGRAVRFARAAVGVAVAMDAAVYVAVLTPVLPALVPEPIYVARYDIANELYGWDDVAAAVRRRAKDGGRTVVMAGHYVMCAQLAWNLRDTTITVRCRTTGTTDFDLWYPDESDPVPAEVLYVSDERFSERPAGPGGAPPPPAIERVVIERGGVPVRRFDLTLYPARAVSRKPSHGLGEGPNPGAE